MSRTPLSRLIALVIGLAAGFATPGSALAHGRAHRHEALAHHDAEQLHELADSGHDHPGPTLEVSVPDAGDHPHPTVGEALTSKAAQLLAVVAVLHVAVPVSRTVLVEPPLPEQTLQLRPEAAHAPPPSLRAPPALLA